MRRLTDLEVSVVSGGDGGDILVLGVRQQRQDGGGGGGLSHYNYADPHPVYGGGGHSAGGVPPADLVPPDDHAVTAAVKVHVDDASHMNEAIDAATRVVDALTDIQEKIEANPNGSFSFGGKVYSGSDLKSIIDNTQWIVDDAKTYNNFGVGAAGNGVDHLNYHAFSGQAFSSNSYGSDYYGGQGVEAMVLHEIAHMTDAGHQVNSEERLWNRRAGGNDRSYYASEYSASEEAWAHGFETAAAAGLGIAVNVYESVVSSAQQYGTYRTGERIYASHHPGSPNL